MKRISALVLSLLIAASSLAGNRIPASEALGKAAEFFNGATVSGRVKMASSAAQPLKLVKTAADDAFYIYTRDGGGFVIVSGDDAIGPYLAYSYENSFRTDNMPDNLRCYLSMLEDEVRYYRANKGVKAPTAKFSHVKTASEKVLTTAKWAQDTPYWDLCPTWQGRRCVTGCVATAMAIVLRYKKWPEKGTGHLDSYYTDTYKFKVEGYDLGHSYDWDNMPLTVGYSTTSAQKNQIATLIHDCGVMVEMDYTPDGSGAMSEAVLPALVEHMGYDAGNILRYRDVYNSQEWMSMIKESIDNDCPVLYSGVSSDGGHEFVLDGYNGDKYVSINFGWGGSGNGMYMLTEMGGFTQYCDAIFNLRKDEGNPPLSETLLFIEGKGLSIEGSYSPNASFYVGISELDNYSTGNFNGDVAIGLNDKDGELQEIISDIEPFEGSGFRPGCYCPGLYFNCGPVQIKPNRSIQAYFRETSSAPWRKIRFNEENGTVGLLYPAGTDADVEDEMSFEFDKTTGIVTLTFPESVTASCSFSASGCWSFSNNVMSINTGSLPAGDYTITFSVGETVRTITLPIDNSIRAK